MQYPEFTPEGRDAVQSAEIVVAAAAERIDGEKALRRAGTFGVVTAIAVYGATMPGGPESSVQEISTMAALPAAAFTLAAVAAGLTSYARARRLDGQA